MDVSFKVGSSISIIDRDRSREFVNIETVAFNIFGVNTRTFTTTV